MASSDSSADPFTPPPSVISSDDTKLLDITTTLVLSRYGAYSLERILYKRIPQRLVDKNVKHAVELAAVKTAMFRKGDARLCITLFVRAIELTYEEIMANNNHRQPSDSIT